MQLKEYYEKKGYEQGLRAVLKVLKEAVNVNLDSDGIEDIDFDAEDETESGWEATAADFEPELVPNKKVRKVKPETIYKKGTQELKEPELGVYDPSTHHSHLVSKNHRRAHAFDRRDPRGNDVNSRVSTDTVNYRDTEIAPFHIGHTPTDEEVDKAVAVFLDPMKREAKIDALVNRIKTLGEGAVIKSAHITQSTIQKPKLDIHVMVTVLDHPIDADAEGHLAETNCIWVHDLQKSSPVQINLGTAIYLEFEEAPTDNGMIEDNEGNAYTCEEGSYYWTALASTSWKPSEEQDGGPGKKQYAYGAKSKKEKNAEEPDGGLGKRRISHGTRPNSRKPEQPLDPDRTEPMMAHATGKMHFNDHTKRY